MSVKIFAEDSTNVYDNSHYAALEEVENGFQPNTAASSMLFNSVLKVLTKVANAVTKNSSIVVGPSSSELEAKAAIRFMNWYSNGGATSSSTFKLKTNLNCNGMFHVIGNNVSAGTFTVSVSRSGGFGFGDSNLTFDVQASGGSGQHPVVLALVLDVDSSVATLSVNLGATDGFGTKFEEKKMTFYSCSEVTISITGPSGFTISSYTEKYSSQSDSLVSIFSPQA